MRNSKKQLINLGYFDKKAAFFLFSKKDSFLFTWKTSMGQYWVQPIMTWAARVGERGMHWMHWMIPKIWPLGLSGQGGYRVHWMHSRILVIWSLGRWGSTECTRASKPLSIGGVSAQIRQLSAETIIPKIWRFSAESFLCLVLKLLKFRRLSAEISELYLLLKLAFEKRFSDETY